MKSSVAKMYVLLFDHPTGWHLAEFEETKMIKSLGKILICMDGWEKLYLMP